MFLDRSKLVRLFSGMDLTDLAAYWLPYHDGLRNLFLTLEEEHDPDGHLRFAALCVALAADDLCSAESVKHCLLSFSVETLIGFRGHVVLEHNLQEIAQRFPIAAQCLYEKLCAEEPDLKNSFGEVLLGLVREMDITESGSDFTNGPEAESDDSEVGPSDEKYQVVRSNDNLNLGDSASNSPIRYGSLFHHANPAPPVPTATMLSILQGSGNRSALCQD
ncbi:MAG: hypothetical protein K0Q74_838 [Gammaproteobacteria bacterium]|nr:hypothetical protein [Gammaproteobacteria bacterium]